MSETSSLAERAFQQSRPPLSAAALRAHAHDGRCAHPSTPPLSPLSHRHPSPPPKKSSAAAARRPPCLTKAHLSDARLPEYGHKAAGAAAAAAAEAAAAPCIEAAPLISADGTAAGIAAGAPPATAAGQQQQQQQQHPGGGGFLADVAASGLVRCLALDQRALLDAKDTLRDV